MKKRINWIKTIRIIVVLFAMLPLVLQAAPILIKYAHPKHAKIWYKDWGYIQDLPAGRVQVWAMTGTNWNNVGTITTSGVTPLITEFRPAALGSAQQWLYAPAN